MSDGLTFRSSLTRRLLLRGMNTHPNNQLALNVRNWGPVFTATTHCNQPAICSCYTIAVLKVLK